MSGRESSGSNNSGEIPLARRFKPVRGVSSSSYRYLMFGSIFLTLFSVFITIKLKPVVKNSGVLTEGQANTNLSQEELLLGHFPYPEASITDLIAIYPGLKVHKDTYSALKKMRAAAAADGIYLTALSGFRSIDLQREILYGVYPLHYK